MTMNESALRVQGMAAVRELAATLGIRTDDLVVLSDRGYLIVHLSPAPVVARVATLTAWTRAEPIAWLAREVNVTRTVAALGGPVVPPAIEVDPGPHQVDGLAITLWKHTPMSEEPPSPRDVGLALAELHVALAAYPDAMPFLTPVHEQIPQALDALENANAINLQILKRLWKRHAYVVNDLDGWRGESIVLHGDAHSGNLMRSDGRWLWFDFEETCRGPREWDLACLSRTQRLDGWEAIRWYARAAGIPIPTKTGLAPFVRARELEAAAWALGMAHQFPEPYADLAKLLTGQALRPDT